MLHLSILTAELRVSSTLVNTLIAGCVPRTILWKREGEKNQVKSWLPSLPRFRGKQPIYNNEKNVVREGNCWRIERKRRRVSHYICGSYHHLHLLFTFIRPHSLHFNIILHYKLCREEGVWSDCGRKVDVNTPCGSQCKVLVNKVLLLMNIIIFCPICARFFPAAKATIYCLWPEWVFLNQRIRKPTHEHMFQTAGHPGCGWRYVPLQCVINLKHSSRQYN